MKANGNSTKKRKEKVQDIIFYSVLIAWPIVYLVVFKLIADFNAFLLPFKSYDVLTGTETFVGFENFKRAFVNFTSNIDMLYAWKNSLVKYLISIFISLPLNLLFAYFIFKKIYFADFFKVILFLPSIISSMALVVMFTYFVDKVLPVFIPAATGLLADPSKQFGTLIVYSFWNGFGTSMLVYLGSFSSISVEVLEAAKLDGASPFREFRSICLPLIYPTLTTFFSMGVVSIFTDQLSILEFFGNKADVRIQTIGFYLFHKTISASQADYPYLAALGVLMTCVAAPLTFIIRWLMQKFGPSVE